MLIENFDVIIVGGGHAGTEAALAAARLGVNTLLLTHNIETLGQTSCNPAIGGIGKGHLVKEIDALGGVMAQATDLAGIQFRTLNSSKGPAVQATRAQVDRSLYRQAIRRILEKQQHLWIFQQAVDDLILEGGKVVGVITQLGLRFKAHAVVLTTGTFLAGKIHIGFNNYQGGRAGDPPAYTLAERLRQLPLRIARLKTGTPPRLDGKTINYQKLAPQYSDQPIPVFSFLGDPAQHPEQVPCYITHTNQKTHEIIQQGLDRSPLYTGLIEGIGPRYCPSIEDKVVRFADKQAHQIFLEPEGLNTHIVYPNGISTSLPFELQILLVRTISGLENVHLIQPGYAIEYDFMDPRDLRLSLESRYLPGLFLAGQINGTTGYEEAAAQGLIAGLNAARAALQLEPWTPLRSEAYIGVLIDDLITRGTQEPYRMFTSRAEYRLLLREDNADLRLTEKGRKLGLVDDKRWEAFARKRDVIDKEQKRLTQLWVIPNNDATKKCRALDLLSRPEMTYLDLIQMPEVGLGIQENKQAIEQIEIQAKYKGYIERQLQEIERQRFYEEMHIPEDIDYKKISGLSAEVCQKLLFAQPPSLGIAARIPGITPAAISLLLIYLKKRKRGSKDK